VPSTANATRCHLRRRRLGRSEKGREDPTTTTILILTHPWYSLAVGQVDPAENGVPLGGGPSLPVLVEENG